MKEYNVLNEPWVPVMTAAGFREEMSVMDTIRNAHMLRSISADNPHKEFGILQFFSIFLMDALKEQMHGNGGPDDEDDFEKDDFDEDGDLDDDDDGFEDDEDARRIVEEIPVEKLLLQGRFTEETMRKIEERVRELEARGVSFNLFDPHKPFWQVWGDPLQKKPDCIVPVSKMSFEMPSGDSPLYIRHKFEDEYAMTPGDFLIHLCMSARFVLKGGPGWRSNVYSKDPTYFTPVGDNLFETLLLNLLDSALDCRWNQSSSGDTFYGEPWWTKMNVLEEEKRFPQSQINILEQISYPMRVYQAILDEDGLIRRVYMIHGNSSFFESGEAVITARRDPYMLYVYGKNGMAALAPSKSMPFYSNIKTLLAAFQKQEGEGPKDVVKAPTILTHVSRLMDGKPVQIAVYANISSSASYFSDEKYMYTLPAFLLGRNAKNERDFLIRLINASCEAIGETKKQIQAGWMALMNKEKPDRASPNYAAFLMRRMESDCEKQFTAIMRTVTQGEEFKGAEEEWKQMVKDLCVKQYDEAFEHIFLNATKRIQLVKLRKKFIAILNQTLWPETKKSKKAKTEAQNEKTEEELMYD